ncbi:MAG: hypothetical protein MJ078_00490 [Clostridia bacterium]|nr:hypothetical protein [Clostridia bacterium]
MLKKLFRYDWQAQKRLLLPIMGATVGTGLLGLLLLEIVFSLKENASVLRFSLIAFYVLTIITMLACSLVVEFLIVMRYYKNFFTDEGYLTFVLPATIEEQVGAKILSGSLLSFLAFVSICLGLFFAAGIPVMQFAAKNGDMIALIKDVLSAFIDIVEIAPGQIILALVSAVVTLFAEIILLYTAITLGSLLINKHKILGSVLFYFVINTIVGTLNSLISGIFSVTVIRSAENIMFSTLLAQGVSIILYLILGVCGGLFTVYMLKHKINLS